MKAMKREARGLFVRPVLTRSCPRCKQKSLYTEPPFSMAVKTATSFLIGKTRTPRYICLNPSCSSYYSRTGNTFVENGGSLREKKNIFFIPKK